MPELVQSTVTTEEVKGWRGLHLLYFRGSSCSQKLLIALAERSVECRLREVNLPGGQNHTPWFLGINPRGVVPVLVDDGKVITESNDILAHLDQVGDAPPLCGPDAAARAAALRDLAFEDSLHMDLRAVTFNFLIPPAVVRKPKAYFEQLQKAAERDADREGGQGTLQQIAFWKRNMLGGLPDAELRGSVGRFDAWFRELDERLASGGWFSGRETPGAVDIAVYIYLTRLVACGYPLSSGHLPRLSAWHARACARGGWAAVVRRGEPLPARAVAAAHRAVQALRGTALRRYLPGAAPAGPAARRLRTAAAVAAALLLLLLLAKRGA